MNRKIIIGTESFVPNISGVATTSVTLAKNLTKAGWKVFVFAPAHPQAKDNFEFRVFRFKSEPNPFRENFYVARGSKSAVMSEAAKIKPNIIHLQDPTNIGTGLLKFAQKTNTPIVIANHFSLDYLISYLPYLKPLHGLLRSILRKFLSNFYNRCDWVICPTETVKKELLAWGVNKPIAAISNGVDLDRFYAHANLDDFYLKYHLPRNPIALYVGRMDPDKHLDVLIKAIPAVLKKIDVHFVLVGDGNNSRELKKKASDLGIEEAISWPGWIDQSSEDLAKIYQAASVFVIPSPFETQSIVVMEAMAAGLPIVGPGSGALPELIKNRKNGFLFKTDDPHDLAQKLAAIFEDSQIRAKMAKYSLEAISKHRLAFNFQKILKVYEKILDKKQKK